MWPNFLKSKFILAVGILLLAATLYFLSLELNKKYRIRREIKQLENEIAKYQAKNEDLLQLMNYLKTPEYQERQARALLNLQKPGEFAVVLPPQPEDSAAGGGIANKTTGASNLQKWWHYFFAPRNKL